VKSLPPKGEARESRVAAGGFRVNGSAFVWSAAATRDASVRRCRPIRASITSRLMRLRADLPLSVP
jgi:hypothetical protein